LSTLSSGGKAWPPPGFDPSTSTDERLGDEALWAAAFTEIRRRVVGEHLILGQPLAVFRDGQVVNVPPEELAKELDPD